MCLARRSHIKAAVLVTLALGYFLSVAMAQNANRVTGTYTNMYYNEEGGDLLGQELKIVLARDGCQGALQFAEGGPEQLIVVDITIDGTKIAVSLPDSCPQAGQFHGTIQNGTISGQFVYKTGGSEQVILKKGKSYWD